MHDHIILVNNPVAVQSVSILFILTSTVYPVGYSGRTGFDSRVAVATATANVLANLEASSSLNAADSIHPLVSLKHFTIVDVHEISVSIISNCVGVRETRRKLISAFYI